MVLSIFNYLDYRDVIKDFSRSRGITFKSLATSARIHSSYFSRVMKEKAYFSREQLFLIGKDLKFNEAEMDYFLLLGEIVNSGQSGHKNFLLRKARKIQTDKKKLSHQFEKESKELTEKDIDYLYQEAITGKIHMLLTLEKYQENPLLICKKVFISEKKLEQQLSKLEHLGLISRESGEIKVLKRRVHLDENHPASTQNHINWRIETLNRLNQRTPQPSDYHLSAILSGDEEIKTKIKELFKDFVVEAQKLVKDNKNIEDVYYIGMDLF